MKLQTADRPYFFTAYDVGHVQIGEVRFSSNLIIQSEQLWTEWTTHRFADLTLHDMHTLATLDADIILLGTGLQLRFPRSELLQPFMQARKGLEVMDIPATCRTYNLLSSEGRKVAAALLFD